MAMLQLGGGSGSAAHTAHRLQRRIAAGSFHNIVVSNARNRLTSNDTSEDLLQPLTRETQVFAFGSNRNNVIEANIKDYGKSEKEQEEEEEDTEIPMVWEDPVGLDFFKGKYVYEVACGSTHTVFLEKVSGREGAVVWVCGLGTNGRLGVRRPANSQEAAAILAQSGVDGHKAETEYREFWDSVASRTKWCTPCPIQVSIPDKEEVVSVACGSDHTLALTERGLVYAWGLGSFGNLGNGGTDDAETPREISYLSDKPCKGIAAGTKHSLAVSKAGELYSWGYGGNGRLGQGESRVAALIPAKIMVHVQSTMDSVAAGEAHSGSIDTLGNVYTWGAGSYGRLGHGEETDVPVPQRVQELSGIKMIQLELGTLHSIALNSKGELHSWGSGEATGLMEAGGKEAGFAPTLLIKFRVAEDSPEVSYTDLRFTQIAAGPFHSLAMESMGAVYSWGLGSEGRLGLGIGLGLEHKLNPAQIKVGPRDGPTTLRAWVEDFGEKATQHVKKGKKGNDEEEDEARQHMLQSIHCGGMHSCAIVGTGEFSSLWMWGSNEHGQIGSGDNSDHPEPGQVDIKYMKASIRVGCIALGQEHCVLATSDNQKLVYTWGRNSSGQLGLGHMKSMVEPQQLQALIAVDQVSAGEDHSAAIVETGELYTWGSAESGKLGYGSGMTSGAQNYPRMVRFEMQYSQVSCGMQHTAILNKKGNVFTVGAGWYGRLGHGNMDNQYSPRQVSSFDDMTQIVEVRCGAYHTVALVGPERKVYQCGRDRAVCSDDHLTGFQKLQEDLSCQCVAVGLMHTLVVTKEGAVWAWGDNSKGQLGVPNTGKDGKTALARPTEVSAQWSPEWFEGVTPKFCQIASGYGHSMVALTSVDDPSEDPMVYAFGCRNGGRLGLDMEKGTTLRKEIPQPRVVKMLWRSPTDRDTTKRVVVEGGASGAQSSVESKKSKVAIFGVLQKKLASEDPLCSEAALKSQEKKLEESYLEFIQDIWSLWDPPAKQAQDDAEGSDDDDNMDTREWSLRALQSRLEKSVCKNLITMGLAETYPQIDGSLTHPDISSKLVHYEELLWILQQHPCYMGKLAQNLKWGEPTVLPIKGQQHKATIPASLFMDVTGQIFKRLRDDRTKRLFMTLINVMVKFEVEEQMKAEKKERQDAKDAVQLFDPKRSKVAALVRMLVEHPALERLHVKLYDIKKPDSLASIILDWTLQKEDDLADGDKKNQDAKPETDRLTYFVFSEDEMRRFTVDTNAKASGDKQKKQEYDTELSESLHKHQNTFMKFLGVGDTAAPQAVAASSHHRNAGHHARKQQLNKQAEKDKDKGSLSAFIKSLKFETFADLRSIFAMVEDILEDAYETEESIMKQFELQNNSDKQEHDSEKDKQTYAPIMVLFLCSVLGHLMENYEKVMPSSLQEAMKDELSKRWRMTASDEASPEDVLRFNIIQVGKFLGHAALMDFRTTQKKLTLFAKHLRELHVFPHIVDEMQGAQDDTEVCLTQDLYKSHYEMQKITLMLETKDLLHLSNALWLFADQVIDPHEDTKKTDMLFKVLQQTMATPTDKQREEENDPKLDPERKKQLVWYHQLWPDYMLLIAERTSVQHNFTVQHRFLEFHKDLCFCRDCRAPILRSMAPREQRTRSDLRLIRTYRPNPGKKIDDKFPQKTLTDVLSMKELPPIKSRDWISLKSEFEEIQKATRDRISKTQNKATAQKDFQFVESLEKGKMACDLLRTSGHQPGGMVGYVLQCIETRADQQKYLNRLSDGKSGIENDQKEYMEKVKKMVLSLKKVVQVSEEASLPMMFKAKALEKTKPLKFQSVERENRRRAVNDIHAGRPSVTLSLGSLRARKVVAWVSSELPRSHYKRISFTFNGKDTGDWQVIVMHQDKGKSHALFQFNITRADVERMQHAGKTARIPYNDGWVVINAFALLQLLARCTAERS